MFWDWVFTKATYKISSNNLLHGQISGVILQQSQACIYRTQFQINNTKNGGDILFSFQTVDSTPLDHHL